MNKTLLLLRFSSFPLSSFRARIRGQQHAAESLHYALFAVTVFKICALSVAGLGSAGSNMPREAAEQAEQTQHGDQQRAHAQIRSRKPFQVSYCI